jgi:hypothetical protein
MSADNLQNEDFIKFCERINATVGFSSIEVLYAWYFNTFDINANQTKVNTNKSSKNEISKTK